MPNPRLLVAVAAVVALVAGTGTAARTLTGSSHGTNKPPESADAARFLELTGGDRSGMARSQDDEEVERRDGHEQAEGRERSCPKDAATVATLPNGWCLRPAGHSVDVLRFPLGVIPTSNGKVVVTSNSGGVQGLTVVDQKSLQTSQTTAANLFVGLAETKDRRVYAAGGNANRVFRYRWAGDALKSQDLTQDATFPLHNGIDGVVGRLAPGGQNAPAVDGIRVTTYPGALQTYGDYVLAAGTLSEPSDGACPGRRVDGRKLATPFTLKHWTEVYKKTGRDIMPSFIYMSLPQNHTLATTVGNPTPQSMVADNDYAVGLLVDSLSHSPFWGSTAVMQTEDDTQVAGDHVSALRDYLQVASPWAKPGPNHQWGSMPALLRTIEQVFGVKPISLFDRLAAPMHEAFLTSLGAKPNLTPYVAVKPQVPFDVNRPGVVGADLSARMDFRTYDRVDEQLLNAILYAAIRHRPLVVPAD